MYLKEVAWSRSQKLGESGFQLRSPHATRSFTYMQSMLQRVRSTEFCTFHTTWFLQFFSKVLCSSPYPPSRWMAKLGIEKSKGDIPKKGKFLTVLKHGKFLVDKHCCFLFSSIYCLKISVFKDWTPFLALKVLSDQSYPFTWFQQLLMCYQWPPDPAFTPHCQNHYNFIFFISLLEYNCFTMLC